MMGGVCGRGTHSSSLLLHRELRYKKNISNNISALPDCWDYRGY